jgi:hypothetical protein
VVYLEGLPGGLIRVWVNRKHEEYWQSIYGQRQTNSFLKNPSTKESWRIAEPEQIPAKHIDRVADSTQSFVRTSI